MCSISSHLVVFGFRFNLYVTHRIQKDGLGGEERGKMRTLRTETAEQPDSSQKRRITYIHRIIHCLRPDENCRFLLLLLLRLGVIFKEKDLLRPGKAAEWETHSGCSC